MNWRTLYRYRAFSSSSRYFFPKIPLKIRYFFRNFACFLRKIPPGFFCKDFLQKFLLVRNINPFRNVLTNSFKNSSRSCSKDSFKESSRNPTCTFLHTFLENNSKIPLSISQAMFSLNYFHSSSTNFS